MEIVLVTVRISKKNLHPVGSSFANVVSIA